jgi:uncharacterized protein with HEPN domain
MQGCCTKILGYSQGLTKQHCRSDEMLVDAVLRNLEVLGDAAKQIPLAVRERHPQDPWRRIAALRDVLAHAYIALVDDTVWPQHEAARQWPDGPLEQAVARLASRLDFPPQPSQRVMAPWLWRVAGVALTLLAMEDQPLEGTFALDHFRLRQATSVAEAAA